MSTAKRAALIAGAAKGIDRAIARHLVASGWQVGIIDLADSRLRGAFARERDAFAIEGDVRDEETASDAPSKRLFRLSAGQSRSTGRSGREPHSDQEPS